MVSSWCVTSKFTPKNPSSIALLWQHVPRLQFSRRLLSSPSLLALAYVVQMLGSISRSDSSRQALKPQVWTNLGRCTLWWSTEHLWSWRLCRHIAQKRHSKAYAPHLVKSLCVYKHCVSSDSPQCLLTPSLNRQLRHVLIHVLECCCYWHAGYLLPFVLLVKRTNPQCEDG